MMGKYRNILYLMLFFIFVLFMNRLGDLSNERVNERRINDTFLGVVLGHDDYRTLTLRLKLLESGYDIELHGVSSELYQWAEIGDTIKKIKIGNECLLIKKDTSFVLKCYNNL